MAAFLNDWEMEVDVIEKACRDALRFIELTPDVRALGQESLHRDSWPMTDEGRVKLTLLRIPVAPPSVF